MSLSGKNKLVWLLLLVFSAGINISLRMHAASLPQLKGFATEEVYGRVRSNLESGVVSQYGELPESARKKLLESLFSEYLKENRDAVRSSIAARVLEMKSYVSDGSGRVYLSEIDPYRWMRRVEAYLSSGSFATLSFNGREYDALEFAPHGDRIEPIKLHFYAGVFFYQLIHWLNPNLSLMNCLALVPVVLSPLLIVAVFLVCGLLGCRPALAFLASLFIGLSPLVIVRTGYGWFDTDIYNLVFPLSAVSVYALALKKPGYGRPALVVLCGLLFGVYSGLWSSWWLFFYIMLAGIFVYHLQVKTSRPSWQDPLLFIASAYLSVLAISGGEVLINSFREPFSYFSVRHGLGLDHFWPRSAYDVAELLRPGLKDFTYAFGGMILFWGALAAIIFLFFKHRTYSASTDKRFLFVSLFTWLFIVAGLTYFGRRFVLYLIPPAAVFLALVLDGLYARLRAMKFPGPGIGKAIAVAGFSFFVALPVYNGLHAKGLVYMNDSWWRFCDVIKGSTETGAIVNASWTEGDWIMSLGNRATIEDAHWQYTAVPYWFSRVMLSTDEKEAMGILRMLDAGGNRAFETAVNDLKYDRIAAIKLIDRLVSLDKAEGRSFLDGITGKPAATQLYKTVYEPAVPGYLVVGHYLMEMMPALSQAASWDFQRLESAENFSRMGRKGFMRYAFAELGESTEGADKLYRSLVFMNSDETALWISRNHYRFYMPYSKIETDGRDHVTLVFNDALSIDAGSFKSQYFDPGSGKVIIPGKLIFSEGSSVREFPNKAGNPEYAVFLRKDGTDYKAAVFSAPLAETLFFKLYFLKGSGLRYFKLMHQELKEGYDNLYLFRILWDS